MTTRALGLALAAVLSLTTLLPTFSAAGRDAALSPAPPLSRAVVKTGTTDWCGAVIEPGIGPMARMAASDLPPCTTGDCDLPATRDGTPRDPIAVRVLVHVMRESDGSGGVPASSVDSMLTQMNRDFAPHAIRVDKLATLFHNDGAFATLSTREQLAALRDAYAQSPSQNLNLFISAGTLPFDGVGTAPWDSLALTSRGGIWLNRSIVDGVHHSASHELGHCLGLYHTFHGIDEVESCANVCYEPASGANADVSGDLCSDTPSTPINFSCAAPGGSDCAGTPWGATPLHNIMGYGPALCVNEFTPQQERRMLCWAHAVLGSIIVSLAGVAPPVAGREERGLWTAGMGEPSGSARVWYALDLPGRATLALYDVRGRRMVTLVDREALAGRHELSWDGRDSAGARVSPGVYLLRLVTQGRAASGKLVLVR